MEIMKINGEDYSTTTRHNFLEPFVILLRNGSEADPFVDITETIKMVTVLEFNADVRAIAVLRETPLEIQGVKAVTSDGKELIEIRDSLTNIDENHFKVDYTNGRVYLDAVYENSEITYTYKGKGTIFVSSDRVLLNNGREANYIYTLSKFVQEQLSEMNMGDLNDLKTEHKDKAVNAINEVWEMITVHMNRTDNPHNVTKAQVGLGNCDNTADIDKPVSNPQKTYIDAQDQIIINDLTTHKTDYTNPHQTTKAQVGLGNCDNTSDINKPVSTPQKTYIDNADTNLQLQINALQGAWVYIGRINLPTAQITQELLTARALEIMGTTTLQNGWVLLDNENNEWYYSDTNQEWIDMEQSNVYPATNDNLGLVIGGSDIDINGGQMTVKHAANATKLGNKDASYYASQEFAESKADKTNVLEKDNIEPYSPTSSYHPATKKYVDDKLQGSTQWGVIEGDLNNQADLVNALLNKQDAITAWNKENFIASTVQPSAPTSGYILWADTND